MPYVFQDANSEFEVNVIQDVIQDLNFWELHNIYLNKLLKKLANNFF